ncbi:MAG: hypothetical protein GEU71_14660 [Actinobacteria bacterium]|nr:hypothetical protein [Actinomycetota bacterium]
MTTQTRWYESDEFTRDFLPWLYRTWRQGQPRIEVKRTTPSDVWARMSSFKVPCAYCRRSMHPFRERRGDRSQYCGVTCADGLSGSCSKGASAANATAAISQLIQRHEDSLGKQEGLL